MKVKVRKMSESQGETDEQWTEKRRQSKTELTRPSAQGE